MNLSLLLEQLVNPGAISKVIPAVPIVKAIEAETLMEYLPMDSWRDM